MADVFDGNGSKLTPQDKYLLAMIGNCADLKYLERKLIKEMLMPQYDELVMADHLPVSSRIMELLTSVREDTQRLARRKKWKPL
jgi:hypothetical protein